MAQFATQTMSFLDLPLEIRRCIYKLLLDYATHEADLCYSGVRGIKQNAQIEAVDTGIFRLCKITHFEATEVFYAVNSFQLVCPPDVRWWKSSMRSCESLSLWTPFDNLLATAGPHNISKIIRLTMPVQLLEKLVLTGTEPLVATPRLQYLRILPDLSVTNLGTWTTLTWLTLLKCARTLKSSHKHLNRLVEQDGEDGLMTSDVQMLMADLRYKRRSEYQVTTYQPNVINYTNTC